MAPGWAVTAALLAAVTALPAHAQTPDFTSLAERFDRFAEATRDLPDPERVRRFRAELEPQLPGFYKPGRRGAEAYEARIAKALREYPDIRSRFLSAAAQMETRYASAGTRFRRWFPDYRPGMPVFVLHSLGQMDGGTREVDGRIVLIFGADMIASIHDEATVGPLFDHELFHTYLTRFFPPCSTVWCSLWDEGLATYVASRLNPRADDRALLLAYPRPIRPEVERRWSDAVCAVRTRLDSNDPADSDALFSGSSSVEGLPPRFGYLVGMRVAERIAKGRPLDQVAKTAPATVRRLVEEALRKEASCPGLDPR